MAGKSIQMLTQKGPCTHEVYNDQGVPCTLFANQDVCIEREGLEQLQTFLRIQDTLQTISTAQQKGQIQPFWGSLSGSLERVVLTPDFHKGGSIPIGTVAQTQHCIIPQAVGNDICCGMRLLLTDITIEEWDAIADTIMPILRRIYFEGQRQIPLSSKQRSALLKEGLWGLLDTHQETQDQGLWRRFDPKQQEAELEHVHMQGVLSAQGHFTFDDYVRLGKKDVRYDSQIGSIGGGNHFVEFQVVEELLEGTTGHLWNVRPQTIAILIHSGSVGLGHTVGRFFRERARSIYPKKLKHPEHGFYALPTQGPHRSIALDYLDAMANAANFAFGNRLWLGLMALEALERVLQRTFESRLLYDAPHNLIWTEHSSQHFIHRKGASPAYGPLESQGVFHYTGQPVLIPGSMGSSSYLLAGEGNSDSLYSASHGAGRSIPRGKARRINDKVYTDSTHALRIVTPIDPDAVHVRSRSDILKKYHQQLKEEGPFAYKSIGPIIETIRDAHMARPIARMKPLLTVKGH